MLETEKSILGSILINDRVLKKTLLFIEPKDFTNKHNKLIFEVMIKNHYNNVTNDYVTILNELKKINNTDYLDYLLELTNIVPTSENINSYIKVLKEHNNLKILIDTFKTIENDKTIDTIKAISTLEEVIDGLDHIDNTEVSQINDNLESYLNGIADGKQLDKGIPTLYKLLDSKLTIRNGNFIVIASRPARGKTAFTLNLVKHFAQQRTKILFISLEMTKNEILDRLIAIVSGLNISRINDRTLNNHEKIILLKSRKELDSYNINVFDKGSLNIENLINLCTKLKTNKKLDIVIIDYIQLLSSKMFKDNRVNQVGYISRKLKQLAMDLKIPVIALSQLNRNSIDKNNGNNREPNLSDIKSSGDLEQDANAVLFLHQEKETDLDDRFMELIIAKNRGGKIGKINIVFKTATMQFVESEYINGKFEQLNPSQIMVFD